MTQVDVQQLLHMDDLDLAQISSNKPMPLPSAAISPCASVTTVVNEDRVQKVVTMAIYAPCSSLS
jgi:hypothetical protein